MVAARYLPFIGGIETHIHEVSIRMVQRGHYVQILTTDPKGTLTKTEVSAGVHIKRVKAWPTNRDYYIAPGIYKEIAQTHCNIIHFQGYNTFVPLVGIPAALRRNIPFVLTFIAAAIHPGCAMRFAGYNKPVLHR